MSLQVTSDNLEITPSMRALAEQKVSKLINKIKDVPDDLLNVRVVLNKGGAQKTFETKIEVTFEGGKIVGKDFEYSLESSIIKAVDDALRQYKKEKDKLTSSNWKKRRNMKVYQYQEE